ncbi:MAG: hypothetical protein IJD75_01550, partial [Clostridia bacterium]|nr:hypothetical protein [Clostridia bacterium]
GLAPAAQKVIYQQSAGASPRPTKKSIFTVGAIYESPVFFDTRTIKILYVILSGENRKAVCVVEVLLRE